jgi:hypothetical protein
LSSKIAFYDHSSPPNANSMNTYQPSSRRFLLLPLPVFAIPCL